MSQDSHTDPNREKRHVEQQQGHQRTPTQQSRPNQSQEFPGEWSTQRSANRGVGQTESGERRQGQQSQGGRRGQRTQRRQQGRQQRQTGQQGQQAGQQNDRRGHRSPGSQQHAPPQQPRHSIEHGQQGWQHERGQQAQRGWQGQRSQQGWQGQQGQQRQRAQQAQRGQQRGQVQRTQQAQQGRRTQQGRQAQRGQQGQQRQQMGQQTGQRGQQVGQQGQRAGRQPQQVDQGLEYGGEARHDHSGTHVGTRKTFGEPGQEFRQQQSPQSGQEDWQAEVREYPMESGGHEQYGHGHSHETEEGNSPLEPLQDRNRGE